VKETAAEGGSSRRPPALEEPFWGPLHHPWGENSCRSCRLDPVIHNADIAVGSRGTDGSNPVPSSGESRPKIFGASSIKRLSLMDRLGVRRTMALSPAVAVAGESWAAVRGVYRTSPSPPITTGCCAATHRRLCQRRTPDHEARASTGQTDRGAAAGIGGPRLAQPARKSATSLANSAGFSISGM